MIGVTFKEVYDDHKSYSYIQFNDESPFNLAGDDRVSRSLKNSGLNLKFLILKKYLYSNFD